MSHPGCLFRRLRDKGLRSILEHIPCKTDSRWPMMDVRRYCPSLGRSVSWASWSDGWTLDSRPPIYGGERLWTFPGSRNSDPEYVSRKIRMFGTYKFDA